MSVASKNPFDLLGNEDGDAEVAQVSGVATRAAKADVKTNAGRRPAGNGNEAAFRDRNAGSDRNRSKTTEEVPRSTPRGGQGARVRGGRGGRFPREHDDRHSKGRPSSEKTPTGYTEGEAEKRDEEAGEAIAKSDEKAAATEDAGADEDAEPEEKLVSYEEYLAQQAEKKLALGGSLAVRQANEGTSNKQWEAAKPLVKEDTAEFIAATASKTKRERERKTKQVLEIDQRYVEPERPSRGGGERGAFRGGRGGGRGGFERSERGGGESFRGGPRGGARGGPRGGARGRGESRGGPRGGAPRGAPRGGAGTGPVLNPKDENLFPSLGSN